MRNYKEELKEITEILLEPEDDYGEMKKATDDLYDLLVVVPDLEEYVENIVQRDATEYKADKEKPIHMIVTETMQRALKMNSKLILR